MNFTSHDACKAHCAWIYHPGSLPQYAIVFDDTLGVLFAAVHAHVRVPAVSVFAFACAALRVCLCACLRVCVSAWVGGCVSAWLGGSLCVRGGWGEEAGGADATD